MNRDWMPEESWFDLRQGQEIYLFSIAFRLVIELFKPPTGRSRPHLQPSLRLGGAIPLLLHTPGCLAQGQTYVYFNPSSNGSLIACLPAYLLICQMRSHVPDRDSKGIYVLHII
jgi:hypothetical protein